MEGICYIIGAGPVDDIILEPGEKDFVIAADAGYEYLTKLSTVADLVVGDFDSMPHKPNHPNILKYPSEKDDTDMLIAVEEGLRRGYSLFVILGGLGGRLDHTYANIQVLAYIALRHARGYLLGGGQAVTVIKNGSLTFDGERKGVVSVFAVGDSAAGITLRGLKYKLDNATLTATHPLGVSNEFTGVPSEITVTDGSVIVMWQDSADDVIDRLKETCFIGS